MTQDEFFTALFQADNVANVEAVLDTFLRSNSNSQLWVPVGGRENNRGTIEASGDPGRSLVERLTNGIDAVLEAEYELHSGLPDCRSPKEAAVAWLNVPDGGLSEMTPVQRRGLAHRVAMKILSGEGRESRTVEVRDAGVGLKPEDLPNTILSLNESNKMQKHYLAGAYGQGGSSTFAASRFTLIASRCRESSEVGYTLVRYEDLPPEEYKIGRYVYLTLDGEMLEANISGNDFPVGTVVKHFGYDMSSYPSPLGPNSIYGLLNQILFDPVLPVWLDNHDIHKYRRVIKGSRNALNGAVDEGDEERRGPSLSHNVRLFFTSLADFGRIGIEYWVLERPTSANKRPSAAFVNPGKPIILTLNGQNHDEMSQVLIRKSAELPYLSQRLICHIDCNSLTAAAKRALFVSNREGGRRGIVRDLIEQEIVKVLRSDDELKRLNNEAREHGMREQDESAVQQMRKEVARLLRVQGIDVGEGFGGGAGTGETSPQRPGRPHPPRPKPRPIELHEPPTFIRLLWDPEKEISFYAEQRRYLRVETDANSNYHQPNDPSASRINVIATKGGVAFRGSTPLEGGRVRFIFEGAVTAQVGDSGTIRVELSRTGLPTLSDERSFRIIDKPEVRPTVRQVTLPAFKVYPVDGPEDEHWTQLGWPENASIVASSAEMENGTLDIYYSTTFPKYAEQRHALERRNIADADSFTKRYEIWLAVHSLLLYQDQQEQAADAHGQQIEENIEILEARERQERCRLATIAALFASREVQSLGNEADGPE